MAGLFSELSPRVRLLGWLASCAMLVAAAWQWRLGPAHAVVASREARLAVLEGELAAARAAAAQLTDVERDIKALNARVRLTTEIPPDEEEPQDVLRSLYALAAGTAVSISSFTPKAIVARTQYSEQPIELALEGGYHDVGRFFDGVATMPRLMSIRDIEIRAHPKPTATNTVAVSCIATAVVFQSAAPGTSSTPMVRAASEGVQ